MTKEKESFENKLNRLDEIVSKVENETLPLEESIKLFEEGNALIKELKGTLDEAEKKIGSYKKVSSESDLKK
jgi:exodeoxyribonuclease VII small subunit